MKNGIVVSFLLPEARSVAWEQVYDELLNQIARKFGGYTITPGLSGGWIADDGTLVKDNNIRLDVSTIANRQYIEELYSKVTEHARSLGEQALYISIGEQSFVVDLTDDENGTYKDLAPNSDALHKITHAVYLASFHSEIHDSVANQIELGADATFGATATYSGDSEGYVF